MELAEEKLWIDYQRGDGSARESLLQKYLPLAQRLAKIIYSRRRIGDVEFGDYLHLAYVGLLEAMQRYRYNSSAQFSTFAAYRIKGSVLNGIPKMTERGDHISYLRRVQHERTQSILQSDVAVTDFAQILDLVVNIALTHQLDEIAVDDDAIRTEHEPYVSLAYGEIQEHLRQILTRLPERNRKIVMYHYFNQLSFQEIADLLDISKGRVSQLHKVALSEIRELLRHRKIAEMY